MDEDDIRDFLVQNPDYFQNNPELLGLLQIPHSSGSAVSLVERQVSVLRERNVDLRHRLRDLGTMARDNDQLFADTRELVLALLGPRDVDGLHRALMGVLRDAFSLEYASLALFDGALTETQGCRVVAESEVRGKLGGLLARGTAGCGALRADEFEFLFPGARIVGSAAIAFIPGDAGPLGFLAVGSSDGARYASDTGTLFLEFAAEVIGKRLADVGGA